MRVCGDAARMNSGGAASEVEICVLSVLSHQQHDKWVEEFHCSQTKCV